MSKKYWLILSVLVLSTLVFSSCELIESLTCNGNLTSISEADLVGTWEQEGSTATAYIRWQFNDDNTYKIYSELNPSYKTGNWSLDGFVLTTDEDIDLTMTCDKNTITMTFDDGEDGPYTYTRMGGDS